MFLAKNLKEWIMEIFHLRKFGNEQDKIDLLFLIETADSLHSLKKNSMFLESK